MSMPATTAPKSSATYTISRAGAICTACGRTFASDETFHAAVRDTPEGLQRIDVGDECWEAVDKAGLLASWRAHARPHAEKKKVFVDDAVLAELFERLSGADEPAKRSFRFVLGLILMRKRLLSLETTEHNGESGDWWIVKLKGRDEPLRLFDPHLGPEQIGEVDEQLAAVLAGE